MKGIEGSYDRVSQDQNMERNKWNLIMKRTLGGKPGDK